MLGVGGETGEWVVGGRFALFRVCLARGVLWVDKDMEFFWCGWLVFDK